MSWAPAAPKRCCLVGALLLASAVSARGSARDNIINNSSSAMARASNDDNNNLPSVATGVAPQERRQLTGYAMTDGLGSSGIKMAVSKWLWDATVAEATYGHISGWDTSQVTDMSYLFCADTDSSSGLCHAAAASFNEDISDWDTSEVTDMAYMFRKASSFNRPIGGWVVNKVEDMRWMFKYASSFNQDLSGWVVSNVESMWDMFKYAAVFNQDLSGWQIDKVDDMDSMFYSASAFDQDLGWCVKEGALPSGRSTFKGTKCEKTRCGVKREEFDTCDEVAIAFYKILLIVLLVLLPCFGACVCCCQKEDETYFAAARRVLRCCFCCCCCICCRKKKEKSSVNSQPDAGIVPADGCRVPANAPLVGVLKELSSFAFRERDEVRGGAYNKAAAALRMHSVVITSGKEAKKLDGIGKSIAGTIDEFLDKGTVQRLEDYKDRARATVSPRPPVELPPDSPAESPREDPDEEATAPESLETRAAAKAKAAETVERPGFTRKLSSFLFGEREEAALPVFAEAEGEATEQPPPPPPARRWFSEAEPEPTEPKAEEMHQRMAGWYNDAPEAAALRAAWGEYPGTSDALQAWPGFVQVTNAFLDAKLDEA